MTKKTKILFLDEDKRIGHVRMTEELVKDLTELAADLKMSRSSLMRRALESLVLYCEDAVAFKKPTMFGKKPSLQTWLMEREDVHIMTEKVEELAQQMDTAKTPDEKLMLLSKQNLITSHMINLLHKTTMT
jgi:ribosomal protein L10